MTWELVILAGLGMLPAFCMHVHVSFCAGALWQRYGDWQTGHVVLHVGDQAIWILALLLALLNTAPGQGAGILLFLFVYISHIHMPFTTVLLCTLHANIFPHTCTCTYKPQTVKKASKAAYGLCCWVRAMEAYDRVAKVVAPKKEALAAAEGEYSVLMAGLADKKAQLAEVIARLDALNAKLAEMQVGGDTVRVVGSKQWTQLPRT